ncbi:alpha/beta fold hydrolase [Gordonia sp. OPL2]|uniref:alpha/beta fold hydrolase n=1 Tax=Gordonia sp. OPL2 TaxID=2486274 RepID=UPI0016554FE2|nr:alpha/beta fold hydrolase [Gordonia sp. OPL2]ROZ99067.1 alpha/beta fold hydrolase [Gordonia sp. OPL2]
MSFVLVHGAGMGASCWDRLVPLLDDLSVAVDLPGRGGRADVDVRGVTLDDCARAILDDVEAAGAGEGDDRIVLVAHSFAGVSVPRVMAALAPRLAHVVFLSAVVPPDGTRVIDQIDPSVREAVRACIIDGVYHQDRAAAIAMLCNGMTPEQTEWTADQVIDDSAALLEEQVDLSGLAADVPRTYVRLSTDHCYTPDLQERSVGLVGGNVEYLDSGHMAMVSIPEQTAALLNSISASSSMAATPATTKGK